MYQRACCLSLEDLLSVGGMNMLKINSIMSTLSLMHTSKSSKKGGSERNVFMTIVRLFSFKHFERWASGVSFPRENILNSGLRYVL